VTHGASPQSYEPTPNASPQSSSGEDLPGSSLLTLVVDLVTGIIIGAIIGVVVSKAYAAHKRTDSSERVLGWFRSSIRRYAC
jgi:hypothetical protein